MLQAESGGNVHAVSAKGALGLMQVMPQTWQQLRLTLHLGDDAFDRTTYPCGDRYLRQMLDRYGTSGFLAAYNAGPVRYDDHLATGKPLPNETQTYMARLASALHLPQPGSGPSLALDPRLLMFVGTSGTAASTPGFADDTQSSFTRDTPGLCTGAAIARPVRSGISHTGCAMTAASLGVTVSTVCVCPSRAPRAFPHHKTRTAR